MKKKSILLTAVLLLAVLLFFLKEREKGKEGELPTGTPAPTKEAQEPYVAKNVWIVSSGEDTLTFFYDGKVQTMATKGKLTEEIKESVGDVTIREEQVVALVLKPDKIKAKVLQMDEDGMELEGYGYLPFAKDYKVYRLYDGIKEEPTAKILVGSSENEFILEQGKLCAALQVACPELKQIRVLLGTEGYTGYYHKTVEFTADCDYRVTWGTEERSYGAGERCVFRNEEFPTSEGRVTIVPEKGDGKITFYSFKRAEGYPSYRGVVEIAKKEEGFLLVNELSLEEYLYGVLPSEMPSDFAPEALKAQAICARSYAYMGVTENRYAKYGAHVDDSVASQVYNNTKETEAAILAVKDTHGQVLFYQDEVVNCYYFSTSGGYTSAAEDVWENATPVPYLTGKATTYDSESPWYRWQTFVPLEVLKTYTEQALKERYQVVPEQILTYDEEREEFVSKPIETLGEPLSYRIVERGAGEIAKKLLIVGTEGVFLVKNEYNIRRVLAPVGQSIARENGEAVRGSSLLPSAYIELRKGLYKEAEGYLVLGGGYGHGVGMSQCGADAMAKQGATCEDIMEEYYPGTEIGFIYGQ